MSRTTMLRNVVAVLYSLLVVISAGIFLFWIGNVLDGMSMTFTDLLLLDLVGR